MNVLKSLSGLLLVFIISLALTSCSSFSSHSKIPTEPAFQEDDNPQSAESENNNRSIIAVYDAEINTETGTFEITPEERSASIHYPLSQTYPNVLQIAGLQYTPTFWADIKLTHPFPGSGIDFFDPRVIAIIPANPAVRFVYPSLAAVGNNKAVLAPDGYTNMFDNLGGNILGSVNPYKAYFKTQPYRVWSNSGVTTETQRWDMDLAGFGGLLRFKLVVDVCSNYPSPPTPGVDNAPEPVQITPVVGTGLTEFGGTAQVDVTLLDWQGPTNIICRVEAPALYSGTVNLTYSHPSSNLNEYVFSGSIPNTLLAPVGTYNILIGAADTITGARNFIETQATVGSGTFNLVDVTPDTLNFEAENIAVDGNLAFTTGTSGMGANIKLYIFDISNPSSPTYIKSVNMPERTTDVAAYNGYAFVTTGLSGVQIVDATPPQSASIVNVVNTPGIAEAITISNGYAYVADGPYGAGLHVFNASNPQTATYGKQVNIWGVTTEVAVSGSYAYAINDLSGVVICDIHDYATISTVGSFTTSGTPYDVDVLSGYAYVVNLDGVLDVVDIQPPQTAQVVQSLAFTAYQPRIDIANGMAYVTDGGYRNLYIVDISNPLSPAPIGGVTTPNSASDVAVEGDYAFIADVSSVQVANINPPGSAYIAGLISTPANVRGVATSGNYAYLSDYENGLQILDISVPQSAHIVKTVPTLLPCEGGIAYDKGYAYVAAGINGLYIIDVDPVAAAHTVTIIPSNGNAWNVCVSGNYAYLADGAGGLKIIDITTPETAFLVQNLSMPGWAWDVEVSGNYAYASTVSEGLHIIDISTPGSASIINSVALTGMTNGLKVANGYAYVSNGYSGLQIINVNPPLSAAVVNTVVAPGYGFSYDVCLLGGFALEADYGLAFRVIDIDPPATASIITSLTSVTVPYNISTQNGYAYVADLDFGLRIIKLF